MIHPLTKHRRPTTSKYLHRKDLAHDKASQIHFLSSLWTIREENDVTMSAARGREERFDMERESSLWTCVASRTGTVEDGQGEMGHDE